MDDLDLFTARSMTQAVQEFKPIASFFRTTFFGGAPELHNTKLVDLDIYKGKRRVAPYTKSTAKSTPFARTAFKTGAFEIPYIKLNRSLAAADKILKERGIGENIYTQKTPRQRAAEQIVKDMFELEEAIQRAEELQAAQAICQGIVTIKGFEIDAEINLDRDSDLEFTVGATDSWDTDTADIHAQMREYARLIFTKSGYTPNVAIFSPEALDAFFANPEVQSLLDNRRLNVGNLTSTPSTDTFPGARSYGEFAGYSIWEYHELYEDMEDGVEKPLVPAGKIVLASRGMKCVKHYGPIEDFAALIPVVRFSKSWEENDPSIRIGTLSTAPAFINHNPDATALIEVLV